MMMKYLLRFISVLLLSILLLGLVSIGFKTHAQEPTSQILIISTESDTIVSLETTLSQISTVEIVTPFDFHGMYSEIEQFDSLVLVNTSAADFRNRGSLESIEAYVNNGGGLVVIGGDNSYALGGYANTPLGTILPIETIIPNQETTNSLSIVYVVDSSGSMAIMGADSTTTLENAQRGIIQALDLLSNETVVGIIAFNTRAYWVAPLRPLGNSENRELITDWAMRIQAEGGSDIYSALNAVDRELSSDTSSQRHVVLLTDGGASPAGILSLLEGWNIEGITLSVISLGVEPPFWLSEITEIGQGRFYHLIFGDMLLSAFTAETARVMGTYFNDTSFTPIIAETHPITDTLDIDALPELQGFVTTLPKDSATVILKTPDGQPILVTDSYGDGHVAAFTADATAWANEAQFWQQVLTWTIAQN